jgi:hypothetical protein
MWHWHQNVTPIAGNSGNCETNDEKRRGTWVVGSGLTCWICSSPQSSAKIWERWSDGFYAEDWGCVISAKQFRLGDSKLLPRLW